VLARALNIPAISGVKINSIAKGATVVLDTSVPEVIVDPTDEVLADFNERYRLWQEQLSSDRNDSQGQATSLDGYTVPIYGNVGDITTAELAMQNGAEGIGLLRTEFLYMNSRIPPSENMQTIALEAIFSLFSTSPIVVRTLDAGGDKTIFWMNDGKSSMLGVRGVRLYQEYRDYFITHLKAILRAGAEHDLRIMIPMVSVVEEVELVRGMLARAHELLEQSGTPHKYPVPFGVMIETPAAVFMANELAEIVDFFSIGTNDLCQYVMAAERESKSLEELANPMQPAVLRAIKMVAEAANANNIDISVCGEMAGDPVTAKVLLGLGIKSLSMNANAIGGVKKMIRGTELSAVKDKVAKALQTRAIAQSKNIIMEI
jgi:phosphocarrier protein FPr